MAGSRHIGTQGARYTHYTHGQEPAVLASHGRRTAENSAAYLLPYLSPGMSVLDVGCGTGTITLDLAEAVAPGDAEAFTSGKAVGIDASDEPLQIARENAAARGDQRTQFQRGNIMALDYEASTFDVVHAHQVLQHLDDPVGALAEMIRVCKPGGLVAARDADYGGMFWSPELPQLAKWRELYCKIARRNGGEPDAARFMRKWASEAVTRAGHSAGTAHPTSGSQITLSSSSWIYATFEATAAWGQSQAARVSGPSFRGQATKLGTTEAETDAIAESWRAWGESPDATFVIPHVELLIRV